MVNNTVDPEGTGSEIIVSEDSPILAATDPSTAATDRREPSRPGLPFLNFRFYGLTDFTLDYYDSPDWDKFVAGFLTRWRRAVRDPRVSQAPLRGTPFYFTRCNGCGVHILTNRDTGKWLNCRICDTGGATVPLRGDPFDELVHQVSEAVGVVPLNTDSVHVLFVQTPPDVSADVIRETCTRAGMVEIKRETLLAVYMLQEAHRRLAIRPDQHWTVWVLGQTDVQLWARDATPEAISVVVRELQDRASGVLTLSATLSAESVTEMGEDLSSFFRRQEQGLRERIRNGVAQAVDYRQLASNLDNQKQFVEAEQMARAALGVDDASAEGWNILGGILFHKNQYQLASEALERSLELDPTSVLTLGLLAACYYKLGNTSRANELYAKARGLSGGEFLFAKGVFS
jgi:hypothetical protein